MNETKLLLKKRKSSDSYGFDGRKRKPAHISGPVIIYNLREEDIIEDWTAIKKVKARHYILTIHPNNISMYKIQVLYPSARSRYYIQVQDPGITSSRIRLY